MSDTTPVVAPASSPAPGPLVSRLIPRAPWVGALAVVTLLIAAGQFAFLSTTVGQDATTDANIHQTELRNGGNITQAQIDGIEKVAPYMRFIVPGSIVIFGPIMTFIFAGIYFGVFNAMLGGDATYRQVLAVATHAGAINIVQTLFVLPLNYVRESAASATSLGVFVQSFLDETNFVARVLGMIDLFIVWNLIVTAIGLAVLYRRKTAPIAWSLLGVYVVIVLVIAGVMRAFGGA